MDVTLAKNPEPAHDPRDDDGIGYVMENDPEHIWWNELEATAEEEENDSSTAPEETEESGQGKASETSETVEDEANESNVPAGATEAAVDGGVEKFVGPLSTNRWANRSSRRKPWDEAVEKDKYRKYLADHACRRGCPQNVSEEHLLARRKMVRGMSFDIHQAFYMGLILSVISQDPEKVRAKYNFGADITVCRRTFVFANDMSSTTLYGKRSEMFGGDANLTRHGNVGRRGSRSIKAEQVKAVLRYLVEKGSLYGLPVPTVARGSTRLPYVLLPPKFTKFELWDKFNKKFKGTENEVKRRTFDYIWQRYAPHIQIRKFHTDMCDTCDKLISKIYHGKRDDAGKEAARQEWDSHVLHAKSERASYRQRVLSSIKQYEHLDPVAKRFPDHLKGSATRVITFHFAQSVQLPYHTDQAGSIYFKSPLKVHLFGIVDESNRQVNFFFMDEAHTIGHNGTDSHGPDSVLSMLNFFLGKTDNGEENLTIYADNCVGQNKNRYTMQYCSNLVSTGRYKTVQVQFLPVDHTKFSPDAFFGLLKRIFRRTDVDHPNELVTEIASQVKSAAAFTKGREPAWQWKNWKAFLDNQYEAVQGVTSSYHFRISKSAKQGIIIEHGVKDGILNNTLVMESSRHKQTKTRAEKAATPVRLVVLPDGGITTDRVDELLKEVLMHVSYHKQKEWSKYIKDQNNGKIAPKKVKAASKGLPTGGPPTTSRMGRKPANNTPGGDAAAARIPSTSKAVPKRAVKLPTKATRPVPVPSTSGAQSTRAARNLAKTSPSSPNSSKAKTPSSSGKRKHSETPKKK